MIFGCLGNNKLCGMILSAREDDFMHAITKVCIVIIIIIITI